MADAASELELDKQSYEREVAVLRADLLDAQFDLKQAKAGPVILVFSGLDGAGKSETVNLLNEWMDPRHIVTRGFFDPSDEERQRPPMWRFWRELPAEGQLGIFFGGWYSDLLMARSQGKRGKSSFSAGIAEIKAFEKMLCDEGAVVAKYWFHLSKQQQSRQLKRLAENPLTRWRVSDHDWKLHKRYDKYIEAAAQLVTETGTEASPWVVVDGSDEYRRALVVGQHLLETLRVCVAKIESAKHRQPKVPKPAAFLKGHPLKLIDLTRSMNDEDYDRALEKWQGRLNRLSRHPKFQKRSVVLIFEGNDAAGKGGAIRRITAALDARRYRSVPIAAPTDEERAHPYLWRFWRHVPGHGQFTIFDRSWYGRVLVERVEGLCSEGDWRRAYGEINDFERQLSESGAIVVKFWLAISPDEQLKRFKAREKTRFKRFKITAEDWRNRDKWAAYEQAAGEMLQRTGTERAPWNLIPANDKKYARIAVLRALVERIEALL